MFKQKKGRERERERERELGSEEWRKRWVVRKKAGSEEMGGEG